MKFIKPFQTTIETIRAHHWKYYVDVYLGCHFNCTYCLYRGANIFTNVRIEKTAVDGILKDVLDISGKNKKGILDIGGMSDPYQPIEKKTNFMRQLLHSLVDFKQPVFIGTKQSNLILRDIDIMQEMANNGLIEVGFTIITLNENISKKIEPLAPAPEEKIKTAFKLAKAGIPVSFHLAPVIPGMHNFSTIDSLIKEMKNAGGKHIFSCILGARKIYWDSFLESLPLNEFFNKEIFTQAYPPKETFNDIHHGHAANFSHLITIMQNIKDICINNDIGFICENIPAFTTTQLNEGIYLWKLPTVADMANYIKDVNNLVAFFLGDLWGEGFRGSFYKDD